MSVAINPSLQDVEDIPGSMENRSCAPNCNVYHRGDDRLQYSKTLLNGYGSLPVGTIAIQLAMIGMQNSCLTGTADGILRTGVHCTTGTVFSPG